MVALARHQIHWMFAISKRAQIERKLRKTGSPMDIKMVAKQLDKTLVINATKKGGGLVGKRFFSSLNNLLIFDSLLFYNWVS
ncbi:MAG: hypothetical protein FWC16_08745 [Defluviitaleaceae bacterium]|nr:hypothetical protein [Defluviitaleaceae bacterium]MCL2274999.1 hypothetical protein [Defluviitaleaceae bacterium]